MVYQSVNVHAGGTPFARAQADSGGFKVDLSRGERVSRVSSEWFSQPDDECYLSLPDLYAAVRGRADRSSAHG